MAILHAILAAPDFSIALSGRDRGMVSLTLVSHDELIEQCIGAGLEARYRFSIRACRRRSFWFDMCRDEIQYQRIIRFDPITEIHRVAFDTLGDDDPPQTMSMPSRSEAIRAVSSLKKIDVSKLTGGDSRFLEPSSGYLSARVATECRGEYSRITRRISSALTLGMVEIGGLDSGWLRFDWTEQGRPSRSAN